MKVVFFHNSIIRLSGSQDFIDNAPIVSRIGRKMILCTSPFRTFVRNSGGAKFRRRHTILKVVFFHKSIIRLSGSQN